MSECRLKEGVCAHRIDKYVFSDADLIGKGKFSKVYLGINEKTNESVAIKQIRVIQVTSKIALRLLECEIISLQLLNHNNLIRCRDVHSSANHHYIITDFCDGGDLAAVLKRKGPLPEKTIAPLVLDIFLGLEYLAGKSIIHRDLKIKNILLHKGRAVIADFGFSIRCNSLFKDITVGSPVCMSPEAILNNLYGPKTDIWSFGVLLYELLTGSAPLAKCKSEEELPIRIIQPPSFNFTISSDLLQVITMCLAIDESNRISIRQLGETPYIRSLKTQRANGHIAQFEENQIPIYKSVEISTEASISLLKPSKTVCLIFGDISYEVAVALVHYCRFVHKICLNRPSAALSKWLLTVSFTLVRARVVMNEGQKLKNIRDIIHDYHLKYLKCSEEGFSSGISFQDTIEQCRKISKEPSCKSLMLQLVAETELLKKCYQKSEMGRFASKSKCEQYVNFLV